VGQEVPHAGDGEAQEGEEDPEAAAAADLGTGVGAGAASVLAAVHLVVVGDLLLEEGVTKFETICRWPRKCIY